MSLARSSFLGPLVLSLATFAMVAACASNPVSTVRMGGVVPARPSNCELELRVEAVSGELMATYDTVGMVNVRGESGEAPNAPRVLALLKPEACALGGELVVVNASANVERPLAEDASTHSYIIMRQKGQAAAPQTF